MRRSLAAVAGAAVAAVLLVSGCGSSSKSSNTSSMSGSTQPSSQSKSDASALSAKELLDRAKSELQSAESFHISGSVNTDGQQIGMDLGFTNAGSSGSITLAGAKIDLIELGDAAYFKASDDFWKKEAGEAADQILPVVSGKWIKAPTTGGQFADFAELGNKNKFLEQLDSQDGGTASKTDGKTIDGKDCVGIKTSDSIVYLDKSSGRPVEVDATGSDSGKVKFDKYDSVPTPTAPPADQTIDISKIAGH